MWPLRSRSYLKSLQDYRPTGIRAPLNFEQIPIITSLTYHWCRKSYQLDFLYQIFCWQFLGLPLPKTNHPFFWELCPGVAVDMPAQPNLSSFGVRRSRCEQQDLRVTSASGHMRHITDLRISGRNRHIKDLPALAINFEPTDRRCLHMCFCLSCCPVASTKWRQHHLPGPSRQLVRGAPKPPNPQDPRKDQLLSLSPSLLVHAETENQPIEEGFGRTSLHLAKNFGQASKSLKKQAYWHGHAARTATQKTPGWVFSQNPRAHTNKIGISPRPPKPPNTPPNEEYYGHGGFLLRKEPKNPRRP